MSTQPTRRPFGLHRRTTHQVTSRLPNTLYAGTLFVGSQESPYQIEAYDLASLGEPQVVYTAHDPRRQVRAGAPCGDGRICVLDSISSDDKTTEIAAIDVAAHKELWRRPAHGTGSG